MARIDESTYAILGRSAAFGGFLGRKREIDQLQRGLDQALGGRGQLFLVSGDPGIGKTRLADELGAHALERGVEVVWGRCWEGGGAPAYWPWVQLLRSLAGQFGSGGAGPLRERVAALAVRLSESGIAAPSTSGDLPSITAREPEHERFRLFDSIRESLREAATVKPLVLVLDDCHAADHASLSLLTFVARELRQSRILVLVTYRDLEVQAQPGLPELFSTLGREGHSIILGGISEPDVSRFLDAAAGAPQRRSIASALHRVTEGNPFFLGEIVRLLLAEGRITAHADTIEGFSLPESVRIAISRRLELLAPNTRKVLSTAATIGREFDLALLGRLGVGSIAEIRSALDEAEQRAVVGEVPGSIERFRFSHALVPQTLRDDLPRAECRELHRKIGAALEELYSSDLENHLSEIAYHLVEALPSGHAEKAAEYAVRAAARADALLAYEEAARLYALALKALELGARADEHRRCDLMLKLGAAQNACGRFAESRRTFAQAAELATRLRDAMKQAHAVLGCAIVPSTPGIPDPELVRMLEDSLRTLGEDDSAARAMVMARLAEELLWSEDSARREALSRDAVAIARRLRDERALFEVLYRRHITLTGPDTIGDRLELSDEITQLIRKGGGGDAALRAHYLRIADLLEAGDISGVDREIARYVQQVRELRQAQSGVSDLMLAMRALIDGRFEDAEKLAISGFTAGRSRREGFATLILAAQLSLIRREQGRLGELEPIARSFTEQYPAITFPRCALAWVYSETGRRAEAAAEFERLAARGLAAIQRDATWLPSMLLLSEVCAELGDSKRAEELYRLLTPYAALNATLDVYVCYGSVAYYLGMLAATAGDLARAEQHYDAATRFNLSIGSHLWVARTRYRHAALLMARSQSDDAEKALEMIGLALATARSFGLTSLTEKLEALSSPDLSAEAGPDGTVSLLFSDIEASTPMTERLGDLQAQDLIRAHRAIIREQVAAYDGFEVKTMGDGFMIAFSSARRALLCAIAIQRAFETWNCEHPETHIRVSAGLHTGEAIREQGDFYGKAVIVASRIGGKASGGEILVSSTFYELTGAAGDIAFDAAREVELKGLRGTYLLHPVRWREAPATFRTLT